MILYIYRRWFEWGVTLKFDHQVLLSAQVQSPRLAGYSQSLVLLSLQGPTCLKKTLETV